MSDVRTSLRHGLQLGLSLVDTAEMYAGGGAEKLVGSHRRPAGRGLPGEQGPAEQCHA
jgi:aryl-alcohol dehydrogenase-like predicted oxidoreductase